MNIYKKSSIFGCSLTNNQPFRDYKANIKWFNFHLETEKKEKNEMNAISKQIY